MDKIKRLSAALIALTMACGMMTACGSEDSKDDSKAETTTTAAKDADADDGDADSDADADADADADYDPAEFIPDPNYKPTYEAEGYQAFLMFGDMNWLWGNWHHQGYVHSEDFDETDAAGYGYGIDADITGDGEYTVAITKDSIATNNGYNNPQVAIDEDTGAVIGAEGTVVWCVDIVGICDGNFVSGKDEDNGGEWNMAIPKDKNSLDADLDNHYEVAGVGDYNPADITVHVTSIKADGEEIEFDESKFRYGNIEDNNNCYRIEIYNSYGSTVEDPGVDPFALVFNKSLEVTFTIEGLGEVKTFPEVAPFGGDAAAADDGAAAEEEAPAEDAAAEEEAPAEDAAAKEEAAAE